MKKIIIDNFLKNRRKSVKYLFTGLALLSSLRILAQDNVPKEQASSSLFADPLFNVLLGIIILLLIVIAVLGGALKNVAEATKNKHNTQKSGKILSIIALIALLSPGKTTFAQEVIQASKISGNTGLSSGVFYLLALFIAFELLIIFVLISSIKLLVKKEKVEEEIFIKKEEPSFLERFNASVPIEKETDIMLDHNYDGIRELDNDLPPWWKYGFYGTIVFAFVYLIYYHVAGTGDLQVAEYNKSILAAQIEKAEFEKTNVDKVNETNVTMLTDKAEIAKGETLFKETCFACHGKFGEGGVGPNLTDDYWIHGGNIKDIFSTIKFGFPDKGMKSWQADLSAVQIHEISSYIKTIHGSNPANGKAPQGDLFSELTTKKDSLKTDSIQVISTKKE